MALVIVLTVIVLITILVVAFASVSMLERAASRHYAEGIRVQEIAMGAEASVIRSLRQEIAAGSLDDFFVDEVNIPRSRWSMVPQTNVAQPFLPSLFRISSPVSPAAFADGSRFLSALVPTNLASDVSTLAASANGRRVPTRTWTRAKFFRGATEPDVEQALAASPPNWIYFSRGGPQRFINSDAARTADPSLGNNDHVVGRFAFLAYETGGLLNPNLAGHPPDPTVANAQMVGSKGDQAMADLTQVGLIPSQVDALVAWRNPASAASAGAYRRWLTLQGPQAGFLHGLLGDRQFFSRSDFLRYALSNGWSHEAISLFALFQSDPTAPGFYPTYDSEQYFPAAIAARGVNFPYRTESRDQPDVVNPVIPAIRNAKNEPVAAKKFDLNRLLWVTREGPIANLDPGNPIYATALEALGGDEAAQTFLADGTPANIQAAFGLVWDGAPASWNGGLPSATTGEIGQMWVYCSPTGGLGSRASGILTLNEVAQANREPDLFELLQAAILKGSLGYAAGGEYLQILGQQTTPPTNNGARPREYHLDRDLRLFHGEPKYQIARLVANLIDQADGDSYPTTIRLNEEVLWGIEDLPMFHAVGKFNIRVPPGPDSPVPNDDSCYVHQWLGFALWNPHQVTPAYAAPVRFRVICRGGLTNPNFYPDYALAGGGRSSAWDAASIRGINFSLEPSWIEFSASDYANFREPTMIIPDPGFPAREAGTTLSSQNNRVKIGRVQRFGISTGFLYRPEHPDYVYRCAGKPLTFSTDNPDAKAEDLGRIFEGIPYYSEVRGFSFTSITFMNLELQYRAPDGSWRTYDAVYGFRLPYGDQGSQGMNHVMPDDAAYAAGMAQYLAEHPTSPAKNHPLAKRMLDNSDFNLGNENSFRFDPRTNRMNLFNMTNARLNMDVGPGDWGDTQNVIFPILPRVEEQYASALSGPLIFHYDFVGQFGYPYLANNFRPYPNESYSGGAVPFNYVDPDHVQRWGDGGERFDNHPAKPYNTAARPVILNRPFRNVGELGVVYRDTPWRSFDLLSERSGDAGLLEIFTVGSPTTPSVAGKINLNTAPPEVLRALISGADRGLISNIPTLISQASATNLAQIIVDRRNTLGPLENLSGIPSLLPQTNTVDADFPAPKIQREAVSRALAGVGTTRSWNIFLDLVAQSGQMSKNAPDMANFVVQGQRRYWVSISLDRLTGRVLDTHWESVDD